MHAVIRKYSGPGASRLFDELELRCHEVEKIMLGVPGLRTYSLVRTKEGGFSVTICRDRAGTEESTRRASGWIEENFPVADGPPEIIEGVVILHLSP